MDRAGRIVIPKAVRERARLRHGVPLEVRLRDGRVEIEPAPREVRLADHGGFLVAEATDHGAMLTNDIVRGTIEDLRSSEDAGE